MEIGVAVELQLVEALRLAGAGGRDVAGERAHFVTGLELHGDAAQALGGQLHLFDLADERGVVLVERRAVDDELADETNQLAEALERHANDLRAASPAVFTAAAAVG